MGDIFDEMKKIQEEMEVLFREVSRFEHTYTIQEIQGYYPPINVYYDKNKVIVLIEIPGVNKESLSFEISEKLLIAKGERLDPLKDAKGNYHILEIYFGKFERWVHFPFPVEKDNPKIEFKEGLVKLTLMRKKKKEKIIPIK